MIWPKNLQSWVHSGCFELFWSSVTPVDQKLDILGEFFRSANCLANDMQWVDRWAKPQWTCFGWGSSREPPIEPKFFLELLTSYTHLFNTEPRFFIIIWNFPARANVYVVGTYLQVNIFICYVIMSKNARSLFSTMNKYR